MQTLLHIAHPLIRDPGRLIRLPGPANSGGKEGRGGAKSGARHKKKIRLEEKNGPLDDKDRGHLGLFFPL